MFLSFPSMSFVKCEIPIQPSIRMSTPDLSQLETPEIPIELSFPLPKAPETLIHIHLTINSTSLLLFLTTSVGGDASTPASLGTFIYALPDVSQNTPSNSFYYT